MDEDRTSRHCGSPAAHPELCSCGQELDVCRRQHCPRCGHRLPHQPTGLAA